MIDEQKMREENKKLKHERWLERQKERKGEQGEAGEEQGEAKNEYDAMFEHIVNEDQSGDNESEEDLVYRGKKRKNSNIILI